MAASAGDDEFGEYDKPGAERSRRRRGAGDDFDSDLEGELLEEDWLSTRKNTSDGSDEELNDDLLQSDEEDDNMSGHGVVVSLSGTSGLDSSFVLQDQILEEEQYDLEQGYGDGNGEAEEQGYTLGNYEENYVEESELTEDQMEYHGEQDRNETYQDEVLDLDINEPLDDEFQVSLLHSTRLKMDEFAEDDHGQQLQIQVQVREAGEGEVAAITSQVVEAEEMENETEQKHDVKEESDEEEDDDEESGRLRFKTERKDATVIRLSDAATKRRNIPETLELSAQAKADLQEFEEKERQKKQGRFGFRGGRGRGRGGIGGRGGFLGYAVSEKMSRGRMNEQRMTPLIQVPWVVEPRIPLAHANQRQQSPRMLFQDQSLERPQPLMPSHMSNRGPLPHIGPIRPPMDTPRMLSPPQSPQQQAQQPKNIHINPHFRGPASSPVQVRLVPAQNQPRPAVLPQRFPGPPDFQQHIPRNFSPQQRPLQPDSWRGPMPPQERTPFFSGEPRFPAQHTFGQQGPAPLMGPLHQPPGQGPMSFGQQHQQQQHLPPQHPHLPQQHQSLPLPPQQQPPMFQREPPRQGPPLQGPIGMPGPAHHGLPPSPRQQFIPPRQHIPQPGLPFPPQHLQFGMQVQQRGLMPPHPEPSPPRPDLVPHLPPPQHHQPLHPPLLPLHTPPQGSYRPQSQIHHNHTHTSQPRAQRFPHNVSPIRPRMNFPSANIMKPPIQQVPAMQRNSNLREVPVASAKMPAAHVRPIHHPGPVTGPRAPPPSRVKPEVPSTPPHPPIPPTPASASPTPDPEEDEEMRQYRQKIEEQKRLREAILKQKELRRQMQAGARKKELLERLSGQTQPGQAQLGQDAPPPSQASNGTPSAAPRIQLNKPPPVPPAVQQQQQQPRPVPRLQPQATPTQGIPALGQDTKTGVKRTVMQRSASGESDGQMPEKMSRVVKLLGGGDGNQAAALAQQRLLKQKRRPPPHLRQVPVRTVSMDTTDGLQQQNMEPLAPHLGALMVHNRGDGNQAAALAQQRLLKQKRRPPPHLRQVPVRTVSMDTHLGLQPHNMEQLTPHMGGLMVNNRGCGGGGVTCGGPAGWGRGGPMPVRQNQLSVVSVEGLSSSTTEEQLKNLLMSIGPIQMFKMFPQQRKAVAKFVNPQHASSFQQSFHRHMIDLSHIDVCLIDG